jgi:hypothetical protein
MEKTLMVFAQKERLIKDSQDLADYAKRLLAKGRVEQAQKIKAKRDFVLRTLEEIQPNPT